MKKRELAVALLLTMVIATTGCGQGANDKDESSNVTTTASGDTELKGDEAKKTLKPEENDFFADYTEKVESLGCNPANQCSSSGYFVCDDKYLYGIDLKGKVITEGTFYEGFIKVNLKDGKVTNIKKDGTGKLYLNIIGDYIVGSVVEDNDKNTYLFRMMKDGSEYRHIQNNGKDIILSSSPSVVVINEWIYFLDKDNKLCRINESGERYSVIVDNTCYYICPTDNGIVFQLDSDEESLYSVPLSGGEISKLNSEHSYSPIYYDGYIYYQSGETSYHKMKTNGSENHEIYNGDFKNVTVYKDRLYVECGYSGFYFITTDLEGENSDRINCNYKSLYENMKMSDSKEMEVTKYGGFEIHEDMIFVCNEYDPAPIVFEDENKYYADPLAINYFKLDGTPVGTEYDMTKIAQK